MQWRRDEIYLRRRIERRDWRQEKGCFFFCFFLPNENRVKMYKKKKRNQPSNWLYITRLRRTPPQILLSLPFLFVAASNFFYYSSIWAAIYDTSNDCLLVMLEGDDSYPTSCLAKFSPYIFSDVIITPSRFIWNSIYSMCLCSSQRINHEELSLSSFIHLIILIFGFEKDRGVLNMSTSCGRNWRTMNEVRVMCLVL